MFRTVGLLLKPERAAGGLSKIDIPATATDEPYPIGPDPTTWEGAWKSITKPDTMANHICEANSRQYHQADATPFGKEPLRSYYGYTANTTEAHDLIRGTMPSTAVSSLLMRETVAILQTLSNIPQTLREPVSNIVTESQFPALYHIMEEKTSSSPSGRHVRHYKAATKSTMLAQLHSKLMSIPSLTGISPSRWRHITDVMLHKKQGDHRIHRLRIVAYKNLTSIRQSDYLSVG
jgi:hypothetical protein